MSALSMGEKESAGGAGERGPALPCGHANPQVSISPYNAKKTRALRAALRG